MEGGEKEVEEWWSDVALGRRIGPLILCSFAVRSFSMMKLPGWVERWHLFVGEWCSIIHVSAETLHSSLRTSSKLFYALSPAWKRQNVHLSSCFCLFVYFSSVMSSVKIEIHFVNDLWNCLRARFLRFIKTVMLSSMPRNSWTTLFFKPENKFGFHMSSISEACWWISGNTCNSGLVYLTFRVWQW